MSNKKIDNTRRDFIKKAAIGAGSISAVTTGLGFSKAVVDNLGDPDEVEVIKTDVAVVGGGVAGCYAALRLANIDTNAEQVSLATRKSRKIVKQKPRAGSPLDGYLKQQGKTTLDVKMFEYSGRIGGRLLSTPIQGIPAGENEESGPLQYAEFGGFRFDRQMKIVWQTAQALGLTDEPFYYQDITVEQNNIVNVRGDIYTNAGAESNSYNSYPNIKPKERKVLEGGYDLGTYITNLAFEKTLPSASAKKKYKNIESITVSDSGTTIIFKRSFIKGNDAKPKVIIPPGPNGWSFAYVRYHYAFNAGDWQTVKTVSDMYEGAKAKTTIGGRTFYDWSWWALKRYYLSQEAVAYLEDTSGYNEEGTAGTVETNIDENFYFSVKSNGKDMKDLTYYSTDPESRKSAWRHIKQGYSAIPQELFKAYKDITSNKSEEIVKNQLIAFTRLPLVEAGSFGYPVYKCIFLKRQQGPYKAVSGSQALYDYNQAVKAAKAGTTGLSGDDLIALEADKAKAAEILKQYKVVYCSFLILAMPRRSLELINQNNVFFADTGVQRMLRESVHNIPAMRMYVAYEKPWWLNQPPYGASNPSPSESQFYPVGRTRTDLGLRQLYYWCYNKGTDQNGNYVDPNKPAVMLASYTSGDATLYWRAIQDGQPYDLLSGSLTTQAHLYNEAAGKPSTDVNIRNPQAGGPRHGSLVMGVEAHKQIVTLHGMDDQYDKIPIPYYVHFEDWTKDPWGAGWHSWSSSYSKSKYIPLIRKPVNQENIYIIGECYSNVQGWVQGALNAAESMLQCNIGLPWASWLGVDGIWLGQGTGWVTASSNNPDPNPCIDTEY